MNHIHVAFEKGEEGFIDPTRFFEGRPFSVPTWDQKCDDFKLVWKVRFCLVKIISTSNRQMLNFYSLAS